MKNPKKKSGVSFLSAIIPLLVIGLMAIPFFNSHRSTDGQEVKSLVIMDDGKTAFATIAGRLDSYKLAVKAKNMETKKVVSQRVSCDFFREGYLYPGKKFATLVIPQKKEGESRNPYAIYSLNTENQRELQGTIYKDSPFDKPYYWQGTAIMDGFNEEGEFIVALMKNGDLTLVNLEQIERLSGNIKMVRLLKDQIMPVLEIRLYDNTTLYAGLFLNHENTLSIAPEGAERQGAASGAFCLEYYGEEPMLYIRTDGHNQSSLATFFWQDGVQVQNNEIDINKDMLVPFGDYSLYNATMKIISKERILVAGTTGVNPNTSQMVLYLYNRKTGQMEQLPQEIFKELKPDIFSVDNVGISLTENQLIINDSNKSTSMVINLDSGAVDTLDISHFTNQSFTEEVSGFILHGSGGAILSGAGFWILIFLVLVMIGKIIGKRHKKTMEKGIQLTAVINSIEQTGILINNCPQVKLHLKFHVEGQDETAIVKYLVAPGEALTPGITVVIAYDPKTKKAVLLSGDEINVQEVQKSYTNDLMRQGVITPHAVNITETGQQAQAVVMASIPTGKITGSNSEMRITLRVTKPDGTVYDTTVDKTVPQTALALLLVGSVVTVYYKEENPQDIVLQLGVR